MNKLWAEHGLDPCDISISTFNPHSRAFQQDPYSAYARLRETPGLTWYEPYRTWLVSRFAEVNHCVKNPQLVRTLDSFTRLEDRLAQKRRDNWHDMPFHSRFVQFSMLDSDGEVHDRLRAQVFRFFGPAPIAGLRSLLEPGISLWVGEAVERREFEFVEDLAAKVPGYAIGTLMGVPETDCEQIRVWSELIVQYFDVDRSDHRKNLAEGATEAFYDYLQDLVAHRQKLDPNNRPDDLLSKLVAVEAAGLISHDELYSTCMLIVMAGHGSTLDVMGSGLLALLRFPEQQAKLRADPTLMKTAIAEMFRFESPLPFFHRYAAKDIEFCGQSFSQGTRFGLLYGAANRDPAVFDEPQRFDVSRWPNRHLAFGGGAHFCLGNHLARLSMDILFTQLLAMTADIELADEPEFKPGLSARGPVTLPVRITL